MSGALAHLAPEVAAIADRPPEQRIAHLIASRTSWFIAHPVASAACDLVRRTIEAEAAGGRHLLVFGFPRVGKTLAIRQALQMAQVTQPVRMPIVAIEVSSRADEASFYDEILISTNTPFRPRDPVATKKVLTIATLRRLGTRVLVIDEIHNLLLHSDLKRRAFFAVMKHFGNTLGIVFVAAGTHDALLALNAAPEMSARFQHFELTPLALDPTFQMVLSTFEMQLPLRRSSGLAQPRLAERLHEMCEGIIGELAFVLQDAALGAIEAGDECITAEVLDRLGWVAPSMRFAQQQKRFGRHMREWG